MIIALATILWIIPTILLFLLMGMGLAMEESSFKRVGALRS